MFGKSSRVLFLAGLCLALAGSASAQRQQQRHELAPPIVEPATAEMMNPQFWISRISNPDRVIMTPAQIDELNRKNRTRPYELKDVNGAPFTFLPTIVYKDSTLGLQFHITDPLTLKSFPADSLRKRLIRHRNSFNLANLYDRRQVKFDEGQIREIDDRINLKAVPTGVITPKYGILVCASQNMKYPTSEEFWPEPDGWISNNSFSSLDAASPVAVLHTSEGND